MDEKMVEKAGQNQEIQRKLERKKQALRENLQRRKVEVKLLKLDLDRQVTLRKAKLKPKEG